MTFPQGTFQISGLKLGAPNSDHKISSGVSSSYMKLRGKIIKNTDGELSEHSFRHTWRTVARRADVGNRTAHEMGDWSRGDSIDTIYDHGHEKEHYRQEQEKVAKALAKEGYIEE